jgi:hypothetical protein
MSRYNPQDDEMVDDTNLVVILEDADVIYCDWCPEFFQEPLANWLMREKLLREESLDILYPIGD